MGKRGNHDVSLGGAGPLANMMRTTRPPPFGMIGGGKKWSIRKG